MSAIDDWKERQAGHRLTSRAPLDRGASEQPPRGLAMLHFKCPACRCSCSAPADKWQGECRVDAQTDACAVFVQCPFCATFSLVCSFPLEKLL